MIEPMKILREELTAYGPLLTQRHGHVSEYPVVAAAYVSVHRIGIRWKQGLSPQEIADSYERLTLAGVFAALSCYCANRELFDTRIKAEDDETEALANADPYRPPVRA